ncbi:hypothetical protein BB560_003019 [Smittium megazygosporum]|uniref:Pleckstrin homology domain-containing protein n=1 Tax=Smittium megazygosporum TaxID=133381 RepID=A0A2T9ZD97_9FUNG|nr:hypothetical protein BB560_003019 [Smittium megazygosporum]
MTLNISKEASISSNININKGSRNAKPDNIQDKKSVDLEFLLTKIKLKKPNKSNEQAALDSPLDDKDKMVLNKGNKLFKKKSNKSPSIENIHKSSSKKPSSELLRKAAKSPGKVQETPINNLEGLHLHKSNLTETVREGKDTKMIKGREKAETLNEDNLGDQKTNINKENLKSKSSVSNIIEQLGSTEVLKDITSTFKKFERIKNNAENHKRGMNPFHSDHNNTRGKSDGDEILPQVNKTKTHNTESNESIPSDEIEKGNLVLESLISPEIAGTNTKNYFDCETGFETTELLEKYDLKVLSGNRISKRKESKENINVNIQNLDKEIPKVIKIFEKDLNIKGESKAEIKKIDSKQPLSPGNEKDDHKEFRAIKSQNEHENFNAVHENKVGTKNEDTSLLWNKERINLETANPFELFLSKDKNSENKLGFCPKSLENEKNDDGLPKYVGHGKLECKESNLQNIETKNDKLAELEGHIKRLTEENLNLSNKVKHLQDKEEESRKLILKEQNKVNVLSMVITEQTEEITGLKKHIATNFESKIGLGNVSMEASEILKNKNQEYLNFINSDPLSSLSDSEVLVRPKMVGPKIISLNKNYCLRYKDNEGRGSLSFIKKDEIAETCSKVKVDSDETNSFFEQVKSNLNSEVISTFDLDSKDENNAKGYLTKKGSKAPSDKAKSKSAGEKVVEALNRNEYNYKHIMIDPRSIAYSKDLVIANNNIKKKVSKSNLDYKSGGFEKCSVVGSENLGSGELESLVHSVQKTTIRSSHPKSLHKKSSQNLNVNNNALFDMADKNETSASVFMIKEMDFIDLGNNKKIPDPELVKYLSKTMLGEYLYLVQVDPLGSGPIKYSLKLQYFWVHPYIKSLYWSQEPPNNRRLNNSVIDAKKVRYSKILKSFVQVGSDGIIQSKNFGNGGSTDNSSGFGGFINSPVPNSTSSMDLPDSIVIEKVSIVHPDREIFKKSLSHNHSYQNLKRQIQSESQPDQFIYVSSGSSSVIILAPSAESHKLWYTVLLYIQSRNVPLHK